MHPNHKRTLSGTIRKILFAITENEKETAFVIKYFSATNNWQVNDDMSPTTLQNNLNEVIRKWERDEKAALYTKLDQFMSSEIGASQSGKTEVNRGSV